MFKYIKLLLILSFLDIACATQCGKVWLTVSSLWRPITASDKVIDAELEVNWDLDCPPNVEPPDTIKVFTADPAHNKSLLPQLVLILVEYPESYYRTNISVGRPPLPGGWDATGGAALPGPHCLKHYAALYKNHVIITSSCLQIWPTWMYDLRRQLGRLPIGSLMIPGTHNSGCYKHGDLTRRDAFQRYLLTQDRDVWTQLVHGIRYLDIRIGHYPIILRNASHQAEEINHAGHFWINHDMIRINPLSAVLKDIRNFLDVARGEVIIIDFHRPAKSIHLVHEIKFFAWRLHYSFVSYERNSSSVDLLSVYGEIDKNLYVRPLKVHISGNGKNIINRRDLQ